MATRSLTDVFVLMRNNALQNRHIFSEQGPPYIVSMSPQVADDRMALVSSSSATAIGDLDLGGTSTRNSRLPPEWVDGVEEVQYEITRIKQKIRELSNAYDKHLNRPTMDDNDDDEQQIKASTLQLAQMFQNCQRLVQQIEAKSSGGTIQEKKLTKNILISLAAQLQDQTAVFRKKQTDYSSRCARRDEHASQLFDIAEILEPDGEASYTEEVTFNQGLTTAQLQIVEENTAMVRQREREISSVVQSISDLNVVFKDLAGMVAEQGTVLDRIDYNIEMSASSVEVGLKELHKAEKFQKKNRKMIVIIILTLMIVVLLILFVATKT